MKLKRQTSSIRRANHSHKNDTAELSVFALREHRLGTDSHECAWSDHPPATKGYSNAYVEPAEPFHRSVDDQSSRWPFIACSAVLGENTDSKRVNTSSQYSRG